MADISIGDITARLRADTSDFQRQMQQALQQLTQLTQAVAQVQQALSQMHQAQQGAAQGSAQTAASLKALAEAVRESTQAYTQTSTAALAYTKQQDVLREATRQQREEQRQANEEARRAQDVWRTMLGVAGGLGIATSLRAVIGELRQFAVSIVETGAKLELLRLGMAALTGGQTQGERTFATLISLSNRLGIDTLQTTAAFRNFAGAIRGTVLEGDRGQRVFEAVTMASRAMGASSQQTHSALLALEQMISKGTVSMEELRRQLGNALPGAFQIAARAMGVTTQELEKMIRTGTVEAIPFVEKLAEQLRMELGGAADAASQSTTAAFTRLGNELTLLKDNIASSGLLTLLQSLADTAANLLASLRKGAEDREKQLGGPIRPVPPGLEKLSPDIRARQQEIEDLRFALNELLKQRAGLERQGASPGPMIEEMRARLQQLQEAQAGRTGDSKVPGAIAAFQARLQAEGGAGATGPGPVETVLDEIIKKLEEGTKALEKFDKTAGILTGVDANKEKLEAWNKTLQQLEVEISKFSPELLQAIGPRLATLMAGANDISAALQAEKELPQQAKTEVQTIRQRVHEREREAEQDAEKSMQQALQDARQRVREQEQAEAAMASAVEAASKRVEQADTRALERLQRLAAQYGLTKEARDADTATMLTARLRQTESAEEAERLNEAIQASTAVMAKVPGLVEEAANSFRLYTDAQKAARTEAEALAKLQGTLDQLRAPKDERLDVRLRQLEDAKIVTPEGRERAERLRAQITAQERLNKVAELFEQFGNAVGSAWTNALLSIANGTATVAGAFRAMAQSILQSMAQIASQEAFRALIRFGTGLILGGVTSGLTTTPAGGAEYIGGPGGTAPLNPPPLLFTQGGAIVNKPTNILAGENPAMNPEYVLNQPQMKALMSEAFRAGPSAGGQAANNIAIINVVTREQAEEEAGRQRALGREAIINEVLMNMAQGERSPIVRMMRTTAR